jgi:hypothetical protein
VYPNRYIAVGYFLFLQEQIKDHVMSTVCVFVTAVLLIKLFALGEGESGVD